MPPRRRRRGLELGLILLLNELLQFGMRNIPPVTLGTILGQTLLYMGIINVPWEKEEVCISGNAILKEKDWRRLILSALEHGDDMHLYFNMASFLIKGRSLERRYGSRNFGAILIFLTLVTGVMYVSLAHMMTAIMESDNYMESCAIGFSGVIFALKVLTTHEEPYIRAMLLGIEIPGKYAAWVELIVIHMLVPNSSFMGHFAGILAGVIYCKTYIGTVLDKIITFFTGLVPICFSLLVIYSSFNAYIRKYSVAWCLIMISVRVICGKSWWDKYNIDHIQKICYCTGTILYKLNGFTMFSKWIHFLLDLIYKWVPNFSLIGGIVGIFAGAIFFYRYFGSFFHKLKGFIAVLLRIRFLLGLIYKTVTNFYLIGGILGILVGAIFFYGCFGTFFRKLKGFIAIFLRIRFLLGLIHKLVTNFYLIGGILAGAVFFYRYFGTFFHKLMSFLAVFLRIRFLVGLIHKLVTNFYLFGGILGILAGAIFFYRYFGTFFRKLMSFLAGLLPICLLLDFIYKWVPNFSLIGGIVGIFAGAVFFCRYFGIFSHKLKGLIAVLLRIRFLLGLIHKLVKNLSLIGGIIGILAGVIFFYRYFGTFFSKLMGLIAVLIRIRFLLGFIYKLVTNFYLIGGILGILVGAIFFYRYFGTFFPKLKGFIAVLLRIRFLLGFIYKLVTNFSLIGGILGILAGAIFFYGYFGTFSHKLMGFIAGVLLVRFMLVLIHKWVPNSSPIGSFARILVGAVCCNTNTQ